jgi:hypothetical protein
MSEKSNFFGHVLDFQVGNGFSCKKVQIRFLVDIDAGMLAGDDWM